MANILNEQLEWQPQHILAFQSPYTDDHGNVWMIELIGDADTVYRLAESRSISMHAEPIADDDARSRIARLDERARGTSPSDDIPAEPQGQPVVHIYTHLVKVQEPGSAYAMQVIIDPELVQSRNNRERGATSFWQLTTTFNDTSRDGIVNIHCIADPNPVWVQAMSASNMGYSNSPIALESDTALHLDNRMTFTVTVALAPGADRTTFELTQDIVVPR